MYEVVLRGDDRESVRITDSPLRVGERLEIDGTMWEVESREAAEDPDATLRYILRPAGFVNP